MKTEILRADHPIAMSHAIDVLQHGGLVAFPTDTVYGLASLPFNGEYVDRLFVAKGRSNNRAIAVLIGHVDGLPKIIREMSPIALRLAQQFWPGPLTLVVPGHPNLPEALSPDHSVGVRIPNHPVALSLLRQIGPLAVTSANLSGQIDTNTAQETLAQLNGRIHLILDGGRSPGGQPSTVVDCRGDQPVILRTGPISEESIQQALTQP
jgi:L-threonylcarbamoyladenylate synthase